MHVLSGDFANRGAGNPAVVLEAGNDQTSETWGPRLANIAAIAPVVAYEGDITRVGGSPSTF